MSSTSENTAPVNVPMLAYTFPVVVKLPGFTFPVTLKLANVPVLVIFGCAAVITVPA